MIIKELFFFLGTKVFGENCCGFPLWWWLQNNCLALYQSSASFEFCLKKQKICFENLASWLGMTELFEGHNEEWNVNWKEIQVSLNWLTCYHKKDIFVCCSRKVGLWGRMAAPLKICLCGQVLTLLKQVGCTSLGLLMKGIWQIF